MKKLIIILIALSFVGVCLAASIQDMHKAVIARRNVVPAGFCVGGAFSDNFDDNDYGSDWDTTEVNGTCTNQNGRSEHVVTDASGAAKIQMATDATDQTEYWASFKLTVHSWTRDSNASMQIGGLNSAGSRIINLWLRDVSGTSMVWTTDYEDDTTNYKTDTAVNFVVDTEYTITMHFIAATGDGANDGVAEIWVNDTQILDESTVDSDTLTADDLELGQVYGGSSTTAVELYLDDTCLTTVSMGL